MGVKRVIPYTAEDLATTDWGRALLAAYRAGKLGSPNAPVVVDFYHAPSCAMPEGGPCTCTPLIVPRRAAPVRRE